MIISGLEIIAFQRKNAIDELKNGGETNSRQILKNAWQTAWEVADETKDKFADLNAPFDFFLKECIKNEREQRGQK